MRILTLLAIALASSAFTQGPPPGGPRGGPGGPPPEMRKQFEAMMKWQKSHENVMKLERTLMALPRVMEDKKAKLTSSQAKTILAVIQQWKPKKSVTDKQAKSIVEAIRKPLNKAQLKLLDERPKFGGPGGPGGPGGRPGGPGGPGGPGMGGPPPRGPGGPGGSRPSGPPKMPEMKEYNPLNPSTSPMKFMAKFQTERFNKLISKLKSLAK